MVIIDCAALTGATFFLITSAKFVSRRCTILSFASFDGSFLANLTLCISGLVGREFAMSHTLEGHRLRNMVCRSLGIFAGMKACALACQAFNSTVSWIPFAVSMVMFDNFLWFPSMRICSIINIKKMIEELLEYHRCELLADQIEILRNKSLIRDHQTDFDVYLGQNWRQRSSDAISDGRRYGASALAGGLDVVVQRLEEYLKKIETLPPYTKEEFESMSGTQMKTIEEQMLEGKFALNGEQMERWNDRVETLRDTLQDPDSYHLVWFSTNITEEDKV